MPKLDPFTQRRIRKFVENFRSTQGQLPTLRHFQEAGFSKEIVDLAVTDRVLEEFYVTLTNGAVVKGYKINQG
jgi:hypothetical protein